MSDRRTQGLYGKFEVRRTDGTDAPGGKHDGCTYFVLDLQHDKHMPAALRAYANSCEGDYPTLASQLRVVADGFGSRAEFAGVMAQKIALDLERQRAGHAPASETPRESIWKGIDQRLDLILNCRNNGSAVCPYCVNTAAAIRADLQLIQAGSPASETGQASAWQPMERKD